MYYRICQLETTSNKLYEFEFLFKLLVFTSMIEHFLFYYTLFLHHVEANGHAQLLVLGHRQQRQYDTHMQ